MAIKQPTLDLSKKIAEQIKIEDGAINDTTAYVATLPEEISKEQVEAVRKHDSTFTAAFTHAVHAKTLKAMQEDEELVELAASSDMLGGDRFSMTTRKSREFPKPGSNGDKVTVWGATSTSHTSNAGANRGQLKAVVTETKTNFADAFAQLNDN